MPSLIQKPLSYSIHIILVSGIAIPFSAFAVDTSELNNSATPTATFDEIVVTAEDRNSEKSGRYTISKTDSSTKLRLSQKETPQSVSVVTTQKMKDKNITNLSKALDDANGVTVQKTDGGRRAFYARGYAIDHYQVDGADVNYEGAWLAGEDIAGTDIYDRVEVTKGSTGLMSGNGNPSAGVNLVRKRANNVAPTGEINLNANHYGNYGVMADYGQALNQTGTVRGRIVTSYNDGDTGRDREKNGKALVYAVVDADITPNTSLGGSAKYEKSKQHGTMWGGLPAFYSNGQQAKWDASDSNAPGWTTWDSESKEYNLVLNHAFDNGWNGKIQGNYREATADPKLFYAYGDAIDKKTGVGYKASPGRFNTDRTEKSVSADLKGNFDLFGRTHQFAIGADHDQYKRLAYQYDNNVFAPLGNYYDIMDGSYPEPTWGTKAKKGEIETTKSSAFISTQLKLTEPLALVLGSRITDYKNKGDYYGSKIDQKSDSVVTPFAGVTYAVTKNHSLYASYADIFQPQSGIYRKINGDTIEPITGKSYEIGLKSNNDDNTLTSQITLFKSNRDNVAEKDGANTVTGSTMTPPEQAYRAVDGQETKGFEVEVSGKLAPNWQATMGYSNVDAKARDGSPTQTGVPSNTIKLFTTYDMQSVPGLTIGGGVNWSDKRYVLINNPITKTQQKYTQDPVTLVSLMARYAVNKNLDFQLNVDNALDEDYLAGQGFSQLTYGDPLSVSGKLTYRF